jgi:hypothetical protein
MQPLYASLFKGLSENELDHILSSFSAKQCVPNQGLVDVLSNHMATSAQAPSTGGVVTQSKVSECIGDLSIIEITADETGVYRD